MNGELELFGVYLSAELTTSLAALLLTFGLQQGLVRLGLLRQIWHRPLFEIALFVIVWRGVLAALPLLSS